MFEYKTRREFQKYKEKRKEIYFSVTNEKKSTHILEPESSANLGSLSTE